MSALFAVPDELELVEFFGSEPVERSVNDGYWCYEAADGRGVSLRFSFNLFQQSVQTAIYFGAAHVGTMAHEGAQTMTIADQLLTSRFTYAGAEAKLVLRVRDCISFEWSSLRSS